MIILPDHASAVVAVHRCSRLLEPDRAGSAGVLSSFHTLSAAVVAGDDEVGEGSADVNADAHGWPVLGITGEDDGLWNHAAVGGIAGVLGPAARIHPRRP